MRALDKSMLSLAAPFLVLLAFFGFLHRKDNDRVQALPAFVTGIGCIVSSVIRRNSRRQKLLKEILKIKKDLN